MSEKLSPVPAPATVAIPGYRAGIWKADPKQSEIAFSVRQLMVSTVRGRFTGFDVRIVTADDPLDSSVTATIDLASITTGNTRRDRHLRSAAYLNAAKQPTGRYRSIDIRQTDDGWGIDGELTVHGLTRQVPLVVQLNSFDIDRDGRRCADFSATAQLNRRDFGIDSGGPVVSRKVSVSLTIHAVLQK